MRCQHLVVLLAAALKIPASRRIEGKFVRGVDHVLATLASLLQDADRSEMLQVRSRVSFRNEVAVVSFDLGSDCMVVILMVVMRWYDVDTVLCLDHAVCHVVHASARLIVLIAIAFLRAERG